MEPQKSRAQKHSCHKLWYGLPERISKTVERFFYRLGVQIARNPFRWILGCSVIILICISGLFRFRQEKNPTKLWIPPDSDFVSDTEWLMSHHEEAIRPQMLILTGDNVLKQQTLIKLNDITKQVMSVQTSTEKISWQDVCMKIPVISAFVNRKKRQSFLLEDNFFDSDLVSEMNQTIFEPAIHTDTKFYCSVINSLPKACLVFSILDIWHFDNAKIEKDSAEEIITKINTVKISPTYGHAINFSEFLGGVTVDERGRIIAATAVRTEFIVHVNFRNVDMDKMGNIAGTADWATDDVLKWESAFLETMAASSHRLQNQKDKNMSLALYYEAGRSFGDISATYIFKDMDKLIVGTILMFLYVLTILSKRNWVEWRFCLTATGLLSVGCAFILAVGVCSLIGVPYGPVHTSLPFLLLGLGVDDIFIFMASWKKTHTDETNLSKSLVEKIGLTLGHAGSAITITSFTDVIAFLIGATTVLPTLQSYCIYASVGVLVTYLLQITFFIACFTLDARRIEKKRNGILPCIIHENFVLKPPDPSSALSWKFINFLYSRVILTKPGKIVVILMTIVATSAAIIGTFQLKQWFDPTWLLPRESYLNQYINIYHQQFPSKGFDAFIIIGDDIDYSSEFSKIIFLTERLKNTSYVQSIEPWPIDFARFVSTHYNTDLKTTKIVDDDFRLYLSKFLVSRTGGKYQRNFLFNETFTCGKDAPHIKLATIEFKFTKFAGPHEWIPAMDDSKRIASEAQIHGYVAIWCKSFAHWTTDKVISQEVLRNILLALICVMGTTAILIAEIQTCCWILLCVFLTLLNICGFMHFWGLTIDLVSCIGLELSIGLSVDYAAHVAHAFLNAESREDDDNARKRRALIAVRHIGAAVAYGAISTLLPILIMSFSTSYVFTTFGKIFFLMVFFGLWHGLVLLPVVLSTIGPSSLRVTQSVPMSEKPNISEDED